MAVIDFHKAQRYISSTIQIMALVIYHQSQSADSFYSDQDVNVGPAADVLGGAFLIVLATSGLIPIILTLACVSSY